LTSGYDSLELGRLRPPPTRKPVQEGCESLSKYPQVAWRHLIPYDPRIDARPPSSLPLAAVFRGLGHVYALKAGKPDSGQTTQKTTQKTAQKIIALIAQNPEVTRQELAKAIGITDSGVKAAGRWRWGSD